MSTAIAALFSGHAQGYQALSAQAAEFHAQFVRALTAGAAAYAPAEAANTSPFQELLNLINAPTLALTGRPLIGNGADGAPGSGQNGAPGGWLGGDGGMTSRRDSTPTRNHNAGLNSPNQPGLDGLT